MKPYSVACCRVAVALVFSMACLGASAKTITVGRGNGAAKSDFATPADINWASVKPGDVVVVYPSSNGSDTYLPKVNMGCCAMQLDKVQGAGAGGTNITVKAYKKGGIVLDGLLVQASSNIVIQDFKVTHLTPRAFAAVVVQGGSSSITLEGLDVYGGDVGVNFVDAGARNTLKDSRVYENKHAGITLGSIRNASECLKADCQLTVSNNEVYNNKSHGIDVTGPFWKVIYNKVHDNGDNIDGGTSGIHLLSKTDVKGAIDCDYNQVLYNTVYRQKDKTEADGNGIQIDHFCDNNLVAFNVVWGNDGAGINLYVGGNNQIIANTSYGNAQDVGRAVRMPGAHRGEITLTSVDNLCLGEKIYIDKNFCNIGFMRASNNVIYDNLVYSTQDKVPGIFVSREFIDPAKNTNYLYPNLYWNSAGGAALIWGGVGYNSASEIDRVTGLFIYDADGGNVVEPPAFADTNALSTGSPTALSLRKKPSKEGWIIPANPPLPDIIGNRPRAGAAYFGAFYTNP